MEVLELGVDTVDVALIVDPCFFVCFKYYLLRSEGTLQKKKKDLPIISYLLAFCA